MTMAPHARRCFARLRRRRLLAPVAAARAAALSALSLLACALPQAAPAPAWVGRLQTELERVDAHNRADIGVYVRDLDSGASASYKADESWYLASTVKLPVALAVLRGVERGDFSLDTTLTLRAADYVDGSGHTNSHAVGTPLSIRYLIDQMMVYSDNTASDMLIGLVGIGRVNALVQALVPQGFQRITSLADVRRHIYSQLDPAANRLSGKDFLLLKAQRTEQDRRQTLGLLLHVPVSAFRVPTIGEAYDAYYASGLNSGRLDAYGELLATLTDGRALGPTWTTYLLQVMERVKTGAHRIKAGLPPFARFAHKTGTQSARTCDSGIVSVPRADSEPTLQAAQAAGLQPRRDRQVIVVACTRGEFAIAGSDRALRQVGGALCRSGLLSNGTMSHEAACPADPRAAPVLPGFLPEFVPDLGTGER